MAQLPPFEVQGAPPEPFAPPRDAAEALLLHQFWENLTRRLALYAFAVLGRRSWDVALDVAQEAVIAIRVGDGPPPDQRAIADLFATLGPRVQALAKRHLRKERRRGDVHTDAGAGDELSDGGAQARAADQADYDQLLFARVAAALHDDVVALGMLRCIDAGIDGRMSQAQELGVDVNQIKNARRRIGDAIQRIELELNREPEIDDA